jgi:hypothetical protein
VVISSSVDIELYRYLRKKSAAYSTVEMRILLSFILGIRIFQFE